VDVEKRYDVIVAGGGLAGAFAAISAAREGAKVALFEQNGFLGGMATAAPVSVFMQYHVAVGGGEIRELVQGLFTETVRRLRATGMMLETPFSFDDLALRGVLDDLVTEAGVEVFFHTFVAGVRKRGGRVTALRYAGKEGLAEAEGRVFVDATGDGDLAAAAGCPFTIGRADGLMQPMTPTFLVGGVDPDRLPDRKEITRLLREAQARGESPIAGAGFWTTPRPDHLFFNTCHVWNRSGLNVRDLSLAEMEGRRLVRDIVEALRRFIPGFEHAFLARAGTQIGVRETRHLKGLYTLTREDVVTGRHFEDGIARCAYEIDIHALKPGEHTESYVLAPGVFYEIPYRCLIPASGPSNLLVACRALSATHEAHGSLRIMPTLAGVGEAAGLAAARALRKRGRVAAVDGAALKRDLIARGILGDPFPAG
jgi:glycine/D-amino acid oxidase-like deaminating enzyme